MATVETQPSATTATAPTGPSNATTQGTQQAPPTKKTGAPTRPPARPQARSSRHALEPNPFEQSFSSKPSSSASPENHEAKASLADAAKTQGANRKAAGGKERKSGAGTEASNKAAGDAAAASSTSAPSKEGAEGQTPGAFNKRLLPSVASLTSPSNEGGSSYPWSGGIGSLRSGPLSPAMLTGPQGHHPFDPSAFRTGFTPDLSNFKTGLTPLGSAGGYPMPSPGTVNFLNMINSGSAMTPNTLNALTSVAGDHQPPYSDMRTGHSASGSTDYGLSLTRQGNGKAGPPNGPPPTIKGREADQVRGQTGAPAGVVNGAPNGQPTTTQAASGLFLLSQAHQELAKRDGRAPGSMQPPPVIPGDDYNNAKGAATTNNNKRKKSTTSAPTVVKGASPASNSASNKSSPMNVAATGGKPSKKAKAVKDEEQKDELDVSDDDLNDEGGDFGDDEEKRKNFLERNRQAALKCRQRKKAWLQDLQAKVAYFETENGNLQAVVGALRNEVMFLKSQLMQAQQAMQSKGVSMPGPMGGIMAPMGHDGGNMMQPGMAPPMQHHPGMHPHAHMPTSSMPQSGFQTGPGMPNHGGPGGNPHFGSPAPGPKPQPA